MIMIDGLELSIGYSRSTQLALQREMTKMDINSNKKYLKILYIDVLLLYHTGENRLFFLDIIYLLLSLTLK